MSKIKQCSDLFEKVFGSSGGGCYRKCVCGRTHFSLDTAYDWEEGELEELLAKEKSDPNDYISHDVSYVGTINISEKEIVFGCSCNYAKQWEDFLITKGSQIAKYLNKRGDLLRQEAASTKVCLK